MNMTFGKEGRCLGYQPVVTTYKSCLALAFTFIFFALTLEAQINNLILPKDTPVGRQGELGRVDKVGTGPVAMILIADVGFGSNIYRDFIKANKRRYTMYAVTLPGSDQ